MTTEARCPDQGSPERWLQVKSIFEAALELDPMDRVAYLDTACSGDEELRERVDSVLSSDEQGWDLLERAAFEGAADLLAEYQHELSADERIPAAGDDERVDLDERRVGREIGLEQRR